MLASALCVAVVGVAVVAVTSAANQPPAGAAGSRQSHSSPAALSLLSPPGPLSAADPFKLRLAIPPTIDRQSTYLEASLYGCLGSRSSFDQTLGAPPSGSPTRSVSLDPTTLPADTADGVDLSLSLVPGSSPPEVTGAFDAVLRCSSGYGVFPLRIQLLDRNSSASLGSLTAYLVYSAYDTLPENPEPLDLSLLVPVTASGSGTTKANSQHSSASKAGALASLVSLSGSLATSSPRLPVTLVPDPSSLTSTGLPASSLVPVLADLDQGHQVLCGPYTDVDASALVAAGLSSELGYQLREGTSALRSYGVTCPSSADTWMTQQPVDQSALNALAAMGFTQAVVPQSSLAGPAPSQTVHNTFTFGSSRSNSVTAASIDPELSSRLADGSGPDPALAAHQFVAEVEQIYFDAPNAAGRGVLAVAPDGLGSDPQFLEDLVGALETNPLIRSVTLSQFYSQVETHGQYQPASRRTTTVSLPARSIRSTRSDLQSFQSAAGLSARGAVVVQQADQLLLSAESASLSPDQQQQQASAASSFLDQQLRGVSVTTGVIRLASNTAPVPITITKNVAYPVKGVLEVTSDKLVFPAGAGPPGNFCQAPQVVTTRGRSEFSSRCTITHSTNVVYVDMRTRATGDFRVSVAFRSPDGGITLAGAQLTVRAMSISAVSIALSAAAAAVLLVWWGRTLWRRRRSRGVRRPAHAQRARAVP